MKYVCSICGYVFDEADGTKWEQLPDDWKCPWCGAAKTDFVLQSEKTKLSDVDDGLPEEEIKELTAIEMSIICSNLARGCEKQYKMEEAAAFTRLADYFRGKADPVDGVSLDAVLNRINQDISEIYPLANTVATKHADRGALRCLVWSEKVTRILNSLLTRYKAEGDKMLQNTGIYVCTICGFVYMGDELPEICPVCKVTNRKFERAGGGVNG